MMYDLVDELARIDPLLIDQALSALQARYAEFYPDYEVMTLSLLKTADRNAQIDRIILMLQNLKYSDPNKSAKIDNCGISLRK